MNNFDSLEAFEKEIDTMKKINKHPNIIKLEKVCCINYLDEKKYILILEDGNESLSKYIEQRIREKKKFELFEILSILY